MNSLRRLARVISSLQQPFPAAMPATNPIQASPGYRRRILGFLPVFVLAAGLVAAAESESQRSEASQRPASFDSGLNRVREKKSGPAGEPGKSDGADTVKPAKPAEPAVAAAPSAPVATAKPVPPPETAQSRAVASTAVVAPPASLASESSHGIRPREWQLGLAGLLLLVGLWIVWTQENFRMDAEELIKEKKISADHAMRRVSNRKLGGNVSIIGGLFLFLYSLL